MGEQEMTGKNKRRQAASTWKMVSVKGVECTMHSTGASEKRAEHYVELETVAEIL